MTAEPGWSEAGLRRTLMEAVGGDNLSRPHSQSGPVVVRLALTLFQLVGVSQELNTVTMSGSLLMEWEDPRAQWSPATHHGITTIHLPYQSIWTPDVYAYYGLDEERGFERRDLMVRVESSGAHWLELPFRSSSFCGIDVQLFPFDRQNCSITFGSWNYEARFLRFEPKGEPDLSTYYDNQEWVLLDAQAKAALLKTQMAGDFSVIRLDIHIARQPFYYVFNLVIPATVVTLTSILGMHAPTPFRVRRSSRSQLGVVTLLPMGVMLLTIVDNLPKFALRTVQGSRGSFSGVPLLGIYYLALLVTVSICTTSYNIFVWLDRRASERRRIPAWLRWLSQGGQGRRGRVGRRRTRRLSHLQVSMDENTLTAGVMSHKASRDSLADLANGHIGRSLEDIAERAAEAAEQEAWERLIRRLELFSLTFYLLLVAGLLLHFFRHDWRGWL